MKKQLSVLRHEYSELRSKANDLLNRADGDLSGDDASQFEEIASALENIRDEIERGEAAIANLTEQAQKPGNTENSNPVPPKRSANPARDVAMRALDASVQSDRMTGTQAEFAQKVLHTGTQQSRSWTSRYYRDASTPAYESAFQKITTDPARAALSFTDEEKRAWQAVESLRMEQRAALAESSTATGGALVPTHLDPAIILSNNGSNSSLLNISRKVTIATDAWNGVTSEGATSYWKAEGADLTAGDPELEAPKIRAHKATTWVRFSIEVEQDGANFASEVQNVIRDSAEQLVSEALVNGLGDNSNEPTGLMTALAAEDDSLVSGSLDEEGVYALQAALAPRFQANSTFAGSLASLNTLRRLTNEAGAWSFPELRDNPARLLNRATAEISHMTDAALPLVLGDFAQFLVVQRIGATIELVPHLFNNSTGLPTLQRGFILYQRIGSGVLVPNAFRVLDTEGGSGEGEGEGGE